VDWKGSNCGPLSGTAAAFAWSEYGKPQNTQSQEYVTDARFELDTSSIKVKASNPVPTCSKKLIF
jgi:hypothetical protein